jgi:hypothetical protein
MSHRDFDATTQLRCVLHGVALRATRRNTLRGAVIEYLNNLDPHSKEWEQWLAAYSEADLIGKFGVQI